MIDSLLKFIANRFKSIGELKELTANDVNVVSKQTKKLISETLEPGIYMVSTYSEWANDIPSASAIYQITKDGSRAASFRGDMNGGGGITLTTIVKVDSPSTIAYQVYNGHTSGVVAKYISMDVLKIASGGGQLLNSLLSFVSGRRWRHVCEC